MKNILFVCSANKDRSATASDYFTPKFPNLNFDSAGTNHKICRQEGTTPLEEEHIEWADLVIVMEQKHKTAINALTKEDFSKKIHVLNIPDRFTYNQRELVELLVRTAEKLFA